MGYQEESNNIIEITGWTYETFKYMIEFLYSSTISN